MTDEANNRTVLCIENEPETITLIKLILECNEFNVIGALNGRDGLELARQARPDLVLLDLMMPGMDGWEVNLRMKADAELRHIPVVVLTGVDPTNGRDPDLQVDDYLTKPFAPRDLVRRVRNALRSGARKRATVGMSTQASS
jgi:DNA-binding response OmpR family regulator